MKITAEMVEEMKAMRQTIIPETGRQTTVKRIAAAISEKYGISCGTFAVQYHLNSKMRAKVLERSRKLSAEKRNWRHTNPEKWRAWRQEYERKRYRKEQEAAQTEAIAAAVEKPL